ncbi:MAG: ATP-binding protein [Thermoplasmata archaeon]
MREIVLLSGKGGTGKTVVLASFASLAEATVLADCDVDAPNLHLLLDPVIKHRGAFSSRKVAEIDGRSCNSCMDCVRACRFEAFALVGNSYLKKVAINEDSCEGCGVCIRICKSRAITLRERETGEWFVSETRFGPMVHALLAPGGENSGMLVALVKQKARALARDKGSEFVLVDGPPGLSCPAISAASAADIVVLVAEPTMSGLSDFGRIADLCTHIRARATMVVNRWDINPKVTESIEKDADRRGISNLGRIPYDDSIPSLLAMGKTPMESCDSKARDAICDIWHRLQEIR